MNATIRLGFNLGGSHRLLARQHRQLAAAGYVAKSCGAATLGSKKIWTIIETDQAHKQAVIEFVRGIGGTVSTQQPYQ